MRQRFLPEWSDFRRGQPFHDLLRGLDQPLLALVGVLQVKRRFAHAADQPAPGPAMRRPPLSLSMLANALARYGREVMYPW
jgi:hypothetical protein